jgi:uncharacterized Fe-S cluster-containing protein
MVYAVCDEFLKVTYPVKKLKERERSERFGFAGRENKKGDEIDDRPIKQENRGEKKKRERVLRKRTGSKKKTQLYMYILYTRQI